MADPLPPTEAHHISRTKIGDDVPKDANMVALPSTEAVETCDLLTIEEVNDRLRAKRICLTCGRSDPARTRPVDAVRAQLDRWPAACWSGLAAIEAAVGEPDGRHNRAYRGGAS